MAVSTILLLLTTAVVTCSSMNIVETAQAASPEFSILVEALIKADLVTTLSGAGPFTVFAPTDAAFAAALTALSITKEQLLARSDLADILKYHVLSGKIESSALQASQTPATVQGLKVMITKDGASVKFASASVTSADLDCSNGVIHTIDTVVLPPSMTIVQTAQAASPEFSILVEALVKAELVTTLSGAGPFTVFAPTDAAFAAALTALSITKEQLLARSDLADILKYHVLSGKIESTALQASQTPATVQGLKVMITKDGSSVKFASASVTSADLGCSNGVIHTIDTVVLPPSMNIVQTALAASPEFSILVEALTKADLVTTLSGAGPFTVFAPTDAAFAAALTALSITKEQLLARSDLADILKYHVLSGKIESSALQASQTPATVQGQTIAIVKDGAKVTFGDATVTAADLACSNGVIHTIDKVVLPPAASDTGGTTGAEDASTANSKFGSFRFVMFVAGLLALA